MTSGSAAGRSSKLVAERPQLAAEIVGADASYRAVLGEAAWARLDPHVRQRFSRRPLGDAIMCFRGVMHTVSLSPTGWLFAQACRLIGTPLAPHQGKRVPMRIELQEDQRLGGVQWRRVYRFRSGRFAVTSTKCRSGTDLTEHLGHGFTMRLKLSEQDGALCFRSSAYELCVAGRRLRIPDWLTPGVTTVLHEQICGNLFRFSLSVDHPLLGRTIFQEGEFYSD